MKNASEWWSEFMVNNLKLTRGILLAFVGFINSILKIFVDVWSWDYVKESVLNKDKSTIYWY